MKIDIQNRTRYRDDDLRCMLRLCFAAVGLSAGYSGRRGVVVSVGYSRRGMRGRAYVGASPRVHGQWMGLWIPAGECNANLLAWVIWHEALHLAGAEHKDMTPEQMQFTKPPRWFSENVPGVERLREEKIAASPPPHAQKIEHYREKLKEATTRAKRAETIRKKWARRLRLAERRGAT